MDNHKVVYYHVVRLNNNELKTNEIIYSNKSLFEARQYLENYAFDFIKEKNGDKAMSLNENKIINTRKTDAKCDPKIYLPICLHRMHNKTSQFWKNLDMDYIITRNPISDSIYELSIYHRQIVSGLIYNDCFIKKVFSLDIVIENKQEYALADEFNDTTCHSDDYDTVLAELKEKVKLVEVLEKTEELLKTN